MISNIDPAEVLAVAEAMTGALGAGGQVIFMGNGGSSADAQHIAAELSGRYAFDRPAMAGVHLSNIAAVTAIGNDYDYDQVFRRQVEAYCREGDVVVGLSTSGNSRNVVLAMEFAKTRGATTVSFTGDCGRMREIADLAVIIPSRETARVQEGYMAACHAVCGIVERSMFGSKAVLVDRDDTLIADIPYCSDPSAIRLLPGAAAAVARLNGAGYKVILVTNQSGIGRGLVTPEQLEAVNARLCELLAAEGGRLDAIYHCPHHPDDGCGCRKPAVGMGVAAVTEHRIDTRRSFMIGDSPGDAGFGEALGMRTLTVSDGFTFADAVDEILGA